MKKSAFVDYQRRAQEFAVGDLVYPFLGGNQNLVGTVQAVWPAIGMVDVEWPHGNERLPVEELQKHSKGEFLTPEVGHSNAPGGVGTVPVSGGPSTVRVAAAFLKKALYWAAADRHYRASGEEIDSDAYRCPRCKEGVLRAISYKRSGGVNQKLLACPECLFLIEKCDVIGHPEYVDDEAEKKKPFSRIRLTSEGKK